MLLIEDVRNLIKSQAMDAFFLKAYGSTEMTAKVQKKRYLRLLEDFTSCFGQAEGVHLFSTSGRTEVGGNHTDHNHGRVLAAGVSVDSIALAAPTDDMRVTMYSEGYSHTFCVDLSDLSPRSEEEGSTDALIRGVAARLKALGYRIGGFNAAMASSVLRGSGLSSSASIEVLLGTILSELYNDGSISPQELAIVGQYAENHFFGKPCGLMDQMACAVGGLVTIDFNEPSSPVVEKVDFDFAAMHYRLIVVDTGGNHADLTPDYAAVPSEMRSVAECLGKEVCREISLEQVLQNISMLRDRAGDRAVLRVLHFFGDNERVVHQVDALKNERFDLFLALINESGDSSWKLLQNCYSPSNAAEQGIPLALAITKHYFEAKQVKGACRVHGGGFAGTIQVFLPEEAVDDYVLQMNGVFGKGAATVLSIRPYPTLCIDRMLLK